MNAPTGPSFSDIHASRPSLWEYLAQLPGSFEAQVFYALMLGATLGMLLHYIRGLKAGAITGSPLSYFVQQNFFRSLAAVSAVAMELAGEVGAGLFTADDVFVGWSLVLLSGFKTGYLGDSLLNKGSREGALTRADDPTRGDSP